MSAAAVLKWAAAEGVRLEVKQGRITWHADHQPPADLLERIKGHRQEVIDTLARQYRDRLAQAAGVPFDCLVAHYFTADDLADMERGLCPDPVALGDLIRTDAAYPFGWTTEALARASERPQNTPPDPFDMLAAQGLELLPEDRIYVKGNLAGSSPDKFSEILKTYARIWIDAMNGEPEYQRQNAGRQAANCWLRTRHIFR